MPAFKEDCLVIGVPDCALHFLSSKNFLPGNQRPGMVLYPLSYAGAFIRRRESNPRPPD